MKRLSRLLAVAAALSLAATACGQVFTAGAAVVNGARISAEELDEQVEAQMRGRPASPGDSGRIEVARQILNQMIRQELLRQEAERRGITVDDVRIEQEFEGVRTQFGTEQEFLDRIGEFGLTPESLRARIRDSLLIDELRNRLVTPVTDEDVQRLYATSEDQFRQVRVKHILFSVDAEHPEAAARQRALTTRARIVNGGDFGALAKELSDDPGSKDKGGELEGFVALSGLDANFAAAAWAAPIDQVTQPVRSQFGFHLIVTLAKRVQPFQEVEARLRTQLQQQSGEAAIGDFLRGAARTASIIVNPRYGDWDTESASIVPHRLFAPPDDVTDADSTFPPPVVPGG